MVLDLDSSGEGNQILAELMVGHKEGSNLARHLVFVGIWWDYIAGSSYLLFSCQMLIVSF